MTQNTSSAVMQQRTEAHDSLDDFPTPPWATRALIEYVIKPHALAGHYLPRMRCWEPCANRGYMVKPLEEYFADVLPTDIFKYREDYMRHDFLMSYYPMARCSDTDWIITNPPFQLAEQIIQHALTIAREGVAVLVRSAFEEGVERYQKLFRRTPPTLMGVFTERVIMHKGVLRDPSKMYLDEATGKMKRPSTATSYKWMVWVKGMDPRPQIWIPPCRRQLERPGDYPDA